MTTTEIETHCSKCAGRHGCPFYEQQDYTLMEGCIENEPSEEDSWDGDAGDYPQ